MKTSKRFPDLVIGDLRFNPPIIQGGMGVGVSRAGLASAVSNAGGLGVIASVGLGYSSQSKEKYEAASAAALRDEIKAARALTDKPIGINIMVALTNYESLVRVCVENKVDVIISGAGLPLRLPQYAGNSPVKLLPIVSSGKAAALICATWLRKSNRLPDAIVIEGPLAGGHLGFSRAELEAGITLEQLIKDVRAAVAPFKADLPLIAAGGVYTGQDIERALAAGAQGVQMATRFVCTTECDVALPYKQAYLNAKEEDIIVINSPVGLPGRVIKNRFVERILSGEKIKFSCPYHCLRTCNARAVNYCIADALVNAAKGDLDNGFAMSGQNAYRIDKIVSVQELMDELVADIQD